MNETEKLKIRRANIQDIDDYAKIMHESLYNIYHEYISKDYMDKNYSIDSLKRDFDKDINKNDESKELYIITFNEEVIGVLSLGKPIQYYTDGNNYYKDDINGIGEIKSLHIKKDYQRKGIGSIVISFAEDRLKELNYNVSSIWVKQQNYNAINFYISNGYEMTNYINPNTNDKAPSVVMEKSLKKKNILI